MKKLNYILSGFILLLLTPACDKFHNNIQPVDELPTTAVYQSANDLEVAMNGVYNALQNGNGAGISFYNVYIPDLMSANGKFLTDGAPDDSDLSKCTLRSSNLYATGFWIEAYKCINLCNQILKALEVVDDPALTATVRSRLEGEARFVRGFLYFQLVRYYGQPYGDNTLEGGVPILLEGVSKKTEVTFPFRASVQEVYDQVGADLGRALELLPAGQGFDRANPGAAKALLARVAFQSGDYIKASSLAQEIIESGDYALTETPQLFFHDPEEDTDEIIWAVRFTPGDPATGLLGSLAGSIGPTSNWSGITGDLRTAFRNIVTPQQKAGAAVENLLVIDLRSTPGVLVSADTIFTNKYEDPNNTDDVPLARLAEFILMRAEALARMDQLEPAIELLNQIRYRSLRVTDTNGVDQPDKRNLVLFSTADFPGGKDELIDAIVLERRVELCFEGNYLQDLIRLQRPVQGIPYDDCRVRLPIPQREIDVNKNLKQNAPCY